MNWFYPGSLHVKRLKHALVLSMITLTLWMNGVQDRLIDSTVELLDQTQTLLPVANSQVGVFNRIVPLLKKIEASRIGYLIEDYGFPSSDEIKKKCNAVQNVGAMIPSIVSLLKLTAEILKWTSIFLVFQIAYSLFWLGMDLKKGGQKLLTIGLMVIAVLINYKAQGLLHNMNLLT